MCSGSVCMVSSPQSHQQGSCIPRAADPRRPIPALRTAVRQTSSVPCVSQADMPKSSRKKDSTRLVSEEAHEREIDRLNAVVAQLSVELALMRFAQVEATALQGTVITMDDALDGEFEAPWDRRAKVRGVPSTSNSVEASPSWCRSSPDTTVNEQALQELQTEELAAAHLFDAHCHYLDFMQETEGMAALSRAMIEAGVSRAALTGCPLKKSWIAGERPAHPLYDDGDLYHYASTDHIVANDLYAWNVRFARRNTPSPSAAASPAMMRPSSTSASGIIRPPPLVGDSRSLVRLPSPVLVSGDRRFFQLVCGFNLGDYSVGVEAERLLDTFGVTNPFVPIKGIGHLMLRRADYTNVTLKGGLGEDTEGAARQLLEVCGSRSLPFVFSSNACSMSAKPYRGAFEYLHEVEAMLASHRKVPCVWIGAGTFERGLWEGYTQEIHRMMLQYPNLHISLTPDLVAGRLTETFSRAELIELAARFSFRVVLGTTVRGLFETSPPAEFGETAYLASCAELLRFVEELEGVHGRPVARRVRYENASVLYRHSERTVAEEVERAKSEAQLRVEAERASRAQKQEQQAASTSPNGHRLPCPSPPLMRGGSLLEAVNKAAADFTAAASYGVASSRIKAEEVDSARRRSLGTAKARRERVEADRADEPDRTEDPTGEQILATVLPTVLPTVRSPTEVEAHPLEGTAAEGAAAEARAWTTIDSHLHLLDFLQKSSGTKAALSAMDECRVERALLFGMPCCKKWCAHNPKQPLYYQDDDGPCYVYSYADQMIADAWLALDDSARRRFAPTISAFDPTDKAAIDHVRRMYNKYPGVSMRRSNPCMHARTHARMHAGMHAGMHACTPGRGHAAAPIREDGVCMKVCMKVCASPTHTARGLHSSPAAVRAPRCVSRCGAASVRSCAVTTT